MNLDEMLAQTGVREPGFRLMIEHLNLRSFPLIVETGCARQENNFIGDGQSTIIFDNFVNTRGGELHSVDIDPVNVAVAQRQIGPRSRVHCNDSVNFLWQLNRELVEHNLYVDLLYLDSFDLDINNPTPSAQHHLKELTAIIGRLKPGSLIAVDDNFEFNGQQIGKGKLVEEFMQAINKPLIYQGYQYIWKF